MPQREYGVRFPPPPNYCVTRIANDKCLTERTHSMGDKGGKKDKAKSQKQKKSKEDKKQKQKQDKQPKRTP